MAFKLHVVICSTRPTRIGPSIAGWFHKEAVAHGGFDAELVDIAAFNLPVFDEPEHPRLRNYRHAHTKAWSAKVSEADAFVFVTPEYNFGPPPSLVNAMNYLVTEWHYKPAAFVSYGGISGGLRAVQMEKLMLTTFKMMPIPEAVTIPMVSQYFDDEQNFSPSEITQKSVKPLLDELARWTGALKPLRA
ncbi:NADPH-dependent FMN reductase [Microvirga pudoricolor]|uniref:NADPH-dependent FMN reductase n=1 Tax=Microvirga pudoricolor TaxID=2778729 RepID=UPI00194E3B71|nr:NAD(P)H-dependent oxidoreductase [Microvirga pudoricolor]MBM6594067.1 NAD(P)H-dependent oxidoreductase [Microvirga pudoricolor]